jgi:RecG-like helicase
LKKFFVFLKNKKKTLKKLELFSVYDLLHYFPVRYGDFNELSYIKDLKNGDHTNIYAKVLSIKAKKSFRTQIPMTEAVLEDSSGKKITAIWFSQPYIYKMLPENSLARFSGVVTEKNGKKLLSNPEFGKVSEIPLEKTGDLFSENKKGSELTLFPVYRESGVKKGKISSK